MAGRLLGDFTPQAPNETEEPFAFGWFGATIRVGPEFGDLTFTDWAEEFVNLDEDDTRSAYANKVLWQRLLHPDDFAEFWRLARVNGQQSVDLAHLFAAVNKAIIEEKTGRPTLRPGDSSPGPKIEPVNSEDTSSERAIARLEAQGRPDLALVVVKAQEARSA